MYQKVSNVLITCILLIDTDFFLPPQNAKINLDCASKFRHPTYDSDEEYTKKKRARLGISRNSVAAIASFRQHVNDALPVSASVDVDMTEIIEFV